MVIYLKISPLNYICISDFFIRTARTWKCEYNAEICDWKRPNYLALLYFFPSKQGRQFLKIPSYLVFRTYFRLTLDLILCS